MSEQPTPTVANIGKLLKRDGQWVVVCAACGAGKFAKAVFMRVVAVTSLRDQGWHCGPDRRWRCPKCVPANANEG